MTSFYNIPSDQPATNYQSGQVTVGTSATLIGTFEGNQSGVLVNNGATALFLGAPTVTTNAPVTTSTAACADKRSVVLITIEDARHQWPGGSTFLEGADPTSDALNATQTIWQFFAAHSG